MYRPTEPSIQWARKALSPEVKRSDREAKHSPPSSAEVKNSGAIPPLPHVFMAKYLIKYRDNFDSYVRVGIAQTV
jgi:hypothetical protein